MAKARRAALPSAAGMYSLIATELPFSSVAVDDRSLRWISSLQCVPPTSRPSGKDALVCAGMSTTAWEDQDDSNEKGPVSRSLHKAQKDGHTEASSMLLIHFQRATR
jgi:hypothetical protein